VPHDGQGPITPASDVGTVRRELQAGQANVKVAGAIGKPLDLDFDTKSYDELNGSLSQTTSHFLMTTKAL
jgi:hypothetical protein